MQTNTLGHMVIDEVPSADELLTMAVRAACGLVSKEESNPALIRGLLSARAALAPGEDDLAFEEAERAFLEAAETAYKWRTDGADYDGTVWWPDEIGVGGRWPRDFAVRLGSALGVREAVCDIRAFESME